MTCDCNMYKTRGICYHTGYRPIFSDTPKSSKIPEAVIRMHRWLKERKEEA